MTGFSPRIHPPGIITRWFPGAFWKLNPHEKNVYLTFDDGPIPGITPWVLDLLQKEDVRSTFFCVGENVVRHPDIYNQIIHMGHSVGNHTYNHLKGRSSSAEEYYASIEAAAEHIDSDLFRPPHGLMTIEQYRYLSEHYKIIMWDIVSHDFDRNSTPEQVFENVNRFVSNGSIITFHDSVKAFPNLKMALPRVIKMLKDKGYRMDPIPYSGKEDILLQQEKHTGSFFRAS